MNHPRSLFVALLVAGGLAQAADPAPAPAPAEATPPPPSVSLEDIQTFTAVYRAVKEAYVEPVDDHELMQAAVRGLLASLDPHSEYLDTRAVDNLGEQTTGEYGGLGIEVLMLDGRMRVIAPIDDTPASRAGIKPGDVILSIDGTSVGGEDNGTVDRLRGKPGSDVALTIERDGETTPLEVKLKREVIKVASVRVRTLESGYGYVRVTQFQDQTGAELKRKLRQLVSAADGRLRGLVLDLRSNPGGLLNAAVDVSDAFLDEGVIVSTRGRLAEGDVSFSAAKGDLVDGAPLVVLVDAGTASAAEIVAGALKDHRRALIMGGRTFGKGSVQSVLPLDTGYAIKLTTARYFTPSGVSIQAAGIKPDIELEDLRLTRQDGPATPIASEADLPNHLAAELNVENSAIVRDPILDGDYALTEALNVLKGIALAREHGKPRPQDG